LSGKNVIRVESVNFAYGAAPVLVDASLSVDSGDVVSILGPNGGGKTTLLRLILGLERPQSGSIEVLGTTPEAARPRIGYMPQQLRYDNKFPITALQVVLMGVMRRGHFWNSRADKDAAREALGSVGLADVAGEQFATLSGGQRQRVLIARALVSKPELLLFDEPTSMVDASTQQGFAETLERIRKNSAIVIVSHDIGFVSRLVDRVVLVNRTVKSEDIGSVSGRNFEEIYGEALHVVGHHHGHEEDAR
jgi:zinc transport system ATP-binding protein